MASDIDFVIFVMDQFENAGEITSRNIFGEYLFYTDGKLFGLIWNNKYFIKPTKTGRGFIREVVEASPYSGAKPCFLIEDRADDRKWLSELVRISLKELPAPNPKKGDKTR